MNLCLAQPAPDLLGAAQEAHRVVAQDLARAVGLRGVGDVSRHDLVPALRPKAHPAGAAERVGAASSPTGTTCGPTPRGRATRTWVGRPRSLRAWGCDTYGRGCASSAWPCPSRRRCRPGSAASRWKASPSTSAMTQSLRDTYEGRALRQPADVPDPSGEFIGGGRPPRHARGGPGELPGAGTGLRRWWEPSCRWPRRSPAPASSGSICRPARSTRPRSWRSRRASTTSRCTRWTCASRRRLRDLRLHHRARRLLVGPGGGRGRAPARVRRALGARWRRAGQLQTPIRAATCATSPADLMRFRARRIDDPRSKAQAARQVLDFVAGAVPRPEENYQKALQREARILQRCSDEYLLHDHLEIESRPVYFGAFVEHAARLRPALPGRGRVQPDSRAFLPEPVREQLEALADDLIRVRAVSRLHLRAALPADAALQRRPGDRLPPDAAGACRAARARAGRAGAQGSRSRPEPAGRAPSTGEDEVPQGGRRQPDHRRPLVKAVLRSAHGALPRALPFPELLSAVQKRLGVR